jgi:hypothetical protein
MVKIQLHYRDAAERVTNRIWEGRMQVVQISIRWIEPESLKLTKFRTIGFNESVAGIVSGQRNLISEYFSPSNCIYQNDLGKIS